MLRLAVVVGSVALALAGCGGGGAATTSGDDTLDVVAGFYPLAFISERVGGDRVAVTTLTPPGAEPHDLELTPQDVATVTEADLVVHLDGFQPAVDDALELQPGVEAFDAAPVADLSLVQTGGHDPHFWLDPLRLADVADALAERMAELDPAAAEEYAANADALREDLLTLHEDMAAGLADCQVTDLVTGHDAFGYLAARYGFEQVPISGLSPEAEPDPRDLAEIADHVREHGVTTVYSEVLVDPANAETIAAETGARTAVLDPLEGLTDESAGDDYVEVMRANLETLRVGQSCS